MPIDPQAEILRLRTALRDLVALSTIPAAWVGREPPDIAAGLADVLVGSLHLDFAFVRLCDPNGGAAVEVTRGNAWKSFPAWLQDHLAPVGQFSRREIIPDVGGAAEPCRGVVIPIGVNAEGGLVAVACDRTDFPTEIDQLLLSVAANHAATAFQNARLIHERKRAEEELRQARDELEMKVVERTAELRRATAELETILDASPVGIALFGRDQTVQRSNPAFERILGWTADEIAGRPIPVPAANQEEWSALAERLNRGEAFASVETRLLRKDGSEFDAAVACAPLEDERARPLGFVGTIEDISDRKHAEEALRRSEAYLAEAQKLSHTGSWAMNVATGELVHWSRELYRMHNFDPERGLPSFESVIQRIHPEDRARALEILERANREKTDFELDFRTVLPNREMKYLHGVGHPVFNASGDAIEFVGTTMDVTERKRAEFELLRLNRAQRVLNACSQAVAYSGDEQSLLEQVCRAIVETAGYRLAWIGYAERDAARTVRPVAHAGRDSDYVEALDITWADEGRGRGLTGTAIRKGLPIVCRDTTTDPGFLPWREVAARYGFKSSAALPLLIEGSPLGALIVHSTDPDAFDEKELNLLQQAANDVAHGVMVFRARSERTRAEESLRRTQTELAHVARVMTMGELASSIAHEVNQPLAAVTTNCNACLRWLAGDPPNLDEARESLRRIIRDGKRAGEVIARIRSLVKRSAPAKERLDLNEMLQEVLDMIKSEARRHRVSVRTELATHLPPVRGDRVQLQQVILNLVMNGIEATKAVTDRPRELLIKSNQSESDKVLVAVQDTGIGIDQENRERLFEAFYTTKPEGMGMGLSISRSIIEAHGGQLWPTANDNYGATFQFTLPTEDGNLQV